LWATKAILGAPEIFDQVIRAPKEMDISAGILIRSRPDLPVNALHSLDRSYISEVTISRPEIMSTTVIPFLFLLMMALLISVLFIIPVRC